jgi:hypothetical protein
LTLLVVFQNLYAMIRHSVEGQEAQQRVMIQFRTLAASRTRAEFENRWKDTKQEWGDQYPEFALDFVGKRFLLMVGCSHVLFVCIQPRFLAIGLKLGHCMSARACPKKCSTKYAPI